MGTNLEFPLTKKDYAEYASLLIPIIEKQYIIVHAGSRGSWRQWPPPFFAALADYCIEQGFTVVITGTNNEKEITQEVIKCMHHQAIDLTGKTTLGALGALIQNAYMLIANCTGVSHIAAALKTRSLIISMDGEPHRWAPLDTHLHHTIDWIKNPHFEKVFSELATMMVKHKKEYPHNALKNFYEK